MRAELPRAFRWFWAGETASSFGSWVTILTLQVIVVDYLHAGTVGLGWMNAARWLPYLLCAIPVLWVYDLLNLSVLLALAVLPGTATVVNDSASQAFVPRAPSSCSRHHCPMDGNCVMKPRCSSSSAESACTGSPPSG